MRARGVLTKAISLRAWHVLSMATMVVLALACARPARAEQPQTTAWRDGAFHVDTRGLVGRSDVVLAGPSWRDWQSMPLGNGQLGAGVWAQDGFTAQLNRVDLFPDLKSPGQLVIPGLDSLMRADDYRGRLDLYDGELVQSGGGMTARAYVHADRDLFVVDVTGADPDRTQTAELRLWPGRDPQTWAGDDVAALAETFEDDRSGRRTGAVAALTAAARDVHATVVDDHTVRISFKPRADGSFRVATGVPFYTGGDVGEAARAAVEGAGADDLAAGHLAWWHRFWGRVAPMKITSGDGTGEYLETLRALTLYNNAASMRGELPASHGAVINLFSSFRDHSDWYPSGFWHFNLRMQANVNLAAGTSEFNRPYFNLYLQNLDRIEAWTREHMPGTEGACVPETIRFDGTGYYPGQIQCDSDSPPSYVIRILSSGPEVAFNVWRQYQYTGDRRLLEEGYPLMRDVVRFYLSYAHEGADGLLHLEHVNAFENQWDTKDPTTDLSAMKVLFPLVERLARERGDTELADRLRAAIPKIPEFRTVTRNGEQVITWSATDEPSHNFQNPDMEPVWPWGLLGRDSQLAQSTFRNRVFPQFYDWGMDSTWAARLGHADAVKSLLLQGTKDFQIFPNGYAYYGRGGNAETAKSFYQEWGGVVGSGLQEAFAQSHESVVRVAPAWPGDWDVDAALQIQGGHRVSTQIRDGVPNLVGIQAGSTERLRVENPWPGQEVRVVDGTDERGDPIVFPTTADVIEIPVTEGHSYVLERTEFPYPSFAYAPVGGTPETAVKHLGSRTIGVEASEPPPPCTTPTGSDPLVVWDPQSGNMVQDGSSYDRDAEVVGGAAYTTGPDGPALVLDGSRWLRSLQPVNLGRLEQATFEATVRVRSSGTYRRLFDYIVPGSPGDVGFLVDLDPANRVRFIGAGTVQQTDAVVPTDRFVRLTVTLARDGTLTVYLDGTQAWQGSIPAGTIDGCAEMRLQFGADQSGGSRLIGDVDDIRIYPEVRTP